MPLRTLSMTVTKDTLFVAGISDEGLTEELEPEKFWPMFEEKERGVLYVFSKTDGKELGKQKIDCVPIFDGMAVANGRLYISCEGGKLICFGKKME